MLALLRALVLPFTRKLLVVSGLAVLSTILSVVMPLLYRLVFDSAIPNKSTEVLISICITTFILTLASLGCNIAHGYKSTEAAELMKNTLQGRVYEAILRSPILKKGSRSTGDLISVIDNDVPRFVELIQTITFSGLKDILVFIVSICMIFIFNMSIGFLTALVLPLFFISFFLFRARLNVAGQALSFTQGNTMQILEEGISNTRIVKAMAAEQHQVSFLKTAFNKAREHLLRLILLQTTSGAVSTTIMIMGSAVATFVGAYYVIRDQLSIGTMIAIGSWLGYLMGPVNMWAIYALNWQSTKGAAARVLEVLSWDLELTTDETNTDEDIKTAGYQLEVKDLSFSFQPGSPLLNNVCLTIEEGTSIALVGDSGSGKSTFLNLLLGLYPDYSGSVYLGGVEIRRIPRNVLRSKIALVPQEEYFFNASVRHNIAFGFSLSDNCPNIVEEAAMIAGAHEFIMDLPEKYETNIADCGSRLSAGQRQRIAIARALIRRPEILVLDEATAHLDDMTEELILQNLLKQKHRFTLLFVTHRTNSIREFDCIYRISKTGQLTVDNNSISRLHEKIVNSQLGVG